MIEKAKIITADFYYSDARVRDKQTLELVVELENTDSKNITIKGMRLIGAAYKVITLRDLSKQDSIEDAISDVEGMTIRVDIIDGAIVAMINHLQKYVIMVVNGEVVF